MRSTTTEPLTDLGVKTNGEPVQHGNGGYNRGCRCQVCRDGAIAVVAAYMERVAQERAC